MADQSFPQIPAPAWWGFRALLRRTPNLKFDVDTMAAQLNVQQTAARQYILELRKVGLLDDELRATERAHRWRSDEDYGEASKEIVEAVYPEGLLAISPPDAPDRHKAISWFERQQLGTGAARNKAATYFLITSTEPQSPPGANAQSAPKNAVRQRPDHADSKAPAKKSTPPSNKSDSRTRTPTNQGEMPLNINLQIHISADASMEQIDAIFASMRAHLRD